MHKKIYCDIDYQHFLKQEIPKGSTCIAHQVVELKDIHEKFPGGFPTTYRLENTTIHQKFWNENECDYNELGEKLGIEPVTVSTIMQPPGNVIPLHRDTFFKIKAKYPDNTRTIVRCNIYLEDWKAGHFLQCNDDVYTHWKCGDGLIVDRAQYHLSANAGVEDKHTIQVSGFMND